MLLDFYTFWWSVAGAGHFNNPARTRCSFTRNDIVNFDPIEPTETDIFTIEFTCDLQNGRVGSNPVFTCTVIATDTGATPDTNPSARLSGNANLSFGVNPVDLSARVYANQQFTGFIAGNTYAINATIQTNDGSKVSRYSRVYCALPH